MAGRWSELAISRLREMHFAKMSASQICDALNREIKDSGFTRNSVIGKMHRLCLSHERVVLIKSVKKIVTRPVKKRYTSRPRIEKKKIEPKEHVAIGVKHIEPICADFTDTQVQLHELEFNHCRWPIGDPSDIWTFRFCGADRVFGAAAPYCRHHLASAYAPGAKRFSKREGQGAPA